MVSPSSMYTPGLYFIVYMCFVDLCAASDEKAARDCHRDRVYVNLFKVRVDNNSNIQAVIQLLKQFGFDYKKQIVSNFHSFRLRDNINDSSCPIDRDWTAYVNNDMILSIDQDFYRTISHPVYSSIGDVHVNRQLYTMSGFKQNDMTSRPLLLSTSRDSNVDPNSHVTVVVGVLDIGFDMDHTNLKDKINVSLSYDFLHDDADPSPPYYDISQYAQNDPRFRAFSHGTMCMGIIGASFVKGSECNPGICDHIQLAGLKIKDAYRNPTDTQEALALKFCLDDIDIISASYGKADNRGYLHIGQAAREAMRLGVERGRGCKGRIFVFPSGNGGYRDNCNLDGYAKSVHSITITNVEPDLQLPDNVERCSCTLAAAKVDYNFKTTAMLNICIDGFIGSSAAVPAAAGHIANMLQNNPTLTKRDIEHIIVLTSSSHGFTDIQWNTNGANLEFNDRVGFGVLSPQLMLEMAKTWHHVPEQVTCVCEAFNNTVDMEKCCGIRYLEHVEVELEMCCADCLDSDFTQIDIDVISAMDTRSRVMTNVKFRPDRTEVRDIRCRTWTFMTVQFWLEDPIGEWTVNWTSSELDIDVETLNFIFYGTIDDPRTTMGKFPKCTPEKEDTKNPHSDSEPNNLGAVFGGTLGSLVPVTLCFVLIVRCVQKRQGGRNPTTYM